jgi:CDP-diacylglycerol pyrophosphatase
LGYVAPMMYHQWQKRVDLSTQMGLYIYTVYIIIYNNTHYTYTYTYIHTCIFISCICSQNSVFLFGQKKVTSKKMENIGKMINEWI